jgi:hypothetical protein
MFSRSCALASVAAALAGVTCRQKKTIYIRGGVPLSHRASLVSENYLHRVDAVVASHFSTHEVPQLMRVPRVRVSPSSPGCLPRLLRLRAVGFFDALLHGSHNSEGISNAFSQARMTARR